MLVEGFDEPGGQGEKSTAEQSKTKHNTPNPSIAIPALLTTTSIPPGCSLSKKLPKSRTLPAALTSSPQYLTVVKPPCRANAPASPNRSSSSSNPLTASSPRPLSRAHR